MSIAAAPSGEKLRFGGFQDGAGIFRRGKGVPSGIRFSDVFFGYEYCLHDEGKHVYCNMSAMRAFLFVVATPRGRGCYGGYVKGRGLFN